MSGPLTDWFLAHAPKGIGVHARAVGVRFALKANHHGKHADLAVDVLAEDLDMSPGGVRSKVRLLEQLGLLRQVVPPRPGKGNVTPREWVISWCQPLCAMCCLLLDQQQREQRQPEPKGPPGDPFNGEPTAAKRVTAGAKRVTPRSQKGHPVTPLRTGDGSPTTGGTVTHPESDAPAPSQGSGASESGQPADNGKRPLTEAEKRAWRQRLGQLPEQKVARALAPIPDATDRRLHSGPGLAERHSA